MTAVESWIDPELILAECSQLCPEVLDPENDLSSLMECAADYMAWVTAYRYPGCCDRQAEPCWEGCGCSGGGHWITPQMINGQWINRKCGCCHTQQSCCTEEGLPLGPRPVKEVTGITIDGVALDPADWKLTRTGLVVLQNGMHWPNCGGIVIDYRAGQDPPSWVAKAARDLAREFFCQCFCPAKCALPGSWTRADLGAGLMVERDDPSGLSSISPMLSQVMKTFLTDDCQPRRSARVLSPDVPGRFYGAPV